MKTLVVGYGNVTRSDDGVGVRLIEALDKANIPGIETRSAQQLHVEMAEEIIPYETVIFVDAGQTGPEIDFHQIGLDSAGGFTSSHFMAPAVILSLAKKIYGKVPKAWLCSIQGKNFEFGTDLSPEVEERMVKALVMIRALSKEAAHA